MGKNEKTLGLSALVFCLGAGTVAKAESIKVQALRMLSENRITADEYQAMVKGINDSDDSSDEGGIGGSFISDGNYASFISDGNYASFISEANYADFISEGNYADFISEANYGDIKGRPEGAIPSPEIAK